MGQLKIDALYGFFDEVHERLVGCNKRQAYSEIESIKRDYDLQGCGLFLHFMGKQVCLHLTPPQKTSDRIYSAYAIYKFTKRGAVKPTISKHPMKHHSRAFIGGKYYRIMDLEDVFKLVKEMGLENEEQKSV